MHKLIAFLLSFCLVGTKASADFSYDGQHGPDHWGDDFKRCSGKHQSPININELEVRSRDFTALQLEHFGAVPTSANITNNGHTVMVRMSFRDGETPVVRGGPFNFFSAYQFEQFHFHWGENDTIGSEDLINNSAFPAELHVVLRNLKYPDFETALNKDDGLAVLAYFFKIVSLDSEDYIELTDTLQHIPTKGMTAKFEETRPLDTYLSNDIHNYYMYTGSLTTPPCSEDVIWIDFIDPIEISEKQMNRFRQLRSDNRPLMNNFRPPQPLNDRIVYRSKLEVIATMTSRDHAVVLVDRANSANQILSAFTFSSFGLWLLFALAYS